MSKPFLSDTFTDADGVLLNAHTAEKGGKWVIHPAFPSGVIDVQGNTLRTKTASAVYYSPAVPFSADYDVVGVYNPMTTASNFSIMGRLDTTVLTGYNVQYTSTGPALNLVKLVNNGATTLGTFSVTLANGDAVKLKMRGTKIQVYVNSTLRIEAEDSAITSKGVVGVRGNSSAGTTTGIHLDSITATDVLIVPKPMVGGELDTSSTLKVRSEGEWVAPNVHAVTSPGTAPWNGNFDTGDLSQWSGQQLTDSESCVAQQTTRRFARGYAARYQIDPGENAGVAPGDRDRAELLLNAGTTQGIEGRECWYGTSVYFPNNLPTGEFLNYSTIASATNIFWQWHEPAPSWNVPPVRFLVESTGKLRAKVAGGGTYPSPAHTTTYELGQIEYNGWWDFVFHVLWSTEASIGNTEIWAGFAGASGSATPLSVGSPKIAKATYATLFPGNNTAYMKQGFYKDHNSPTNLQSIIYHDETKLGNSFAAVVPTA